MAINFTYDQTQYEEKDFSILPEGDYRVRITDVVEKTFKSGNQGLEITLAVNGHKSHLWFYLVINQADLKQTNQRIGAFFDSFGITNPNLGAYKSWVGKVGAVAVKHDEYNGDKKAKAAYCISKKNQAKLPAWVENTTAPKGATPIDISPDEIPF